MTDFETWFLDHKGMCVRYWIYRRMFTPYEMEQKYIDESCFEDVHCMIGRLTEAVELPDGDILLGFSGDVDDNSTDYIEYFKLSEIRLAFHTHDNCGCDHECGEDCECC